MGSRSDKTRLAELLWMTGKAGDYGSAANRYARLWTVKPGTDGSGGTEVSGGSYAADECSGEFPTASTGDTSVSNDAKITFPTATGNWGDIVAVTISTASSGTITFLAIQALHNTVTVVNTNVFEFAIGALVITVSG